MITLLRPIREITNPLPPCEADRSTVYMRDKEKKGHKCSRTASVVIDGRKLCMAHAGPEAVRKLLTVENPVLDFSGVDSCGLSGNTKYGYDAAIEACIKSAKAQGFTVRA